MSRSIKRHAHWHSGGPNHIKFAKRQANKIVRRTRNIPNGKFYRKIYCTWDIRDWVHVCWSELELLEWCDAEKIYRYYMK